MSEERFHAALIFFGCKGEHGLDAYCRVVSATLADYSYAVERQSILPDGQARITSAQIAVRLRLDLDGVQPRLEITLLTAGKGIVTPDQAQLILLVMLYRMNEAYPARAVEWLSPDVQLPTGRFMSAFGNVSPRRIRGRQEIIDADDARFGPVDQEAGVISDQCDLLLDQSGTGAAPDDTEALAYVFRIESDGSDETEDALMVAENDVRRLTSWGMTGMVMLLSGPVGVSMAAVNLLKGEDFRLNTHVLALTAFLGVTTSTGALAQAVSYLPL